MIKSGSNPFLKKAGMLSGVRESLSGILCNASAISETDILKSCRQDQEELHKSGFSLVPSSR